MENASWWIFWKIIPGWVLLFILFVFFFGVDSLIHFLVLNLTTWRGKKCFFFLFELKYAKVICDLWSYVQIICWLTLIKYLLWFLIDVFVIFCYLPALWPLNFCHLFSTGSSSSRMKNLKHKNSRIISLTYLSHTKFVLSHFKYKNSCIVLLKSQNHNSF